MSYRRIQTPEEFSALVDRFVNSRKALKAQIHEQNTGIRRIQQDTLEKNKEVIDIYNKGVESTNKAVCAVGTKVDRVKGSVDGVKTSVDAVGTKVDTVKTSVDTVGNKVDGVKDEVVKSNTALAGIDTKLDKGSTQFKETMDQTMQILKKNRNSRDGGESKDTDKGDDKPLFERPFDRYILIQAADQSDLTTYEVINGEIGEYGVIDEARLKENRLSVKNGNTRQIMDIELTKGLFELVFVPYDTMAHRTITMEDRYKYRDIMNLVGHNRHSNRAKKLTQIINQLPKPSPPTTPPPVLKPKVVPTPPPYPPGAASDKEGRGLSLKTIPTAAKRLQTLVGSKLAGNYSRQIDNEISEIVDYLHVQGLINKNDAKLLLKKYLG